jgi:hypothetical protein
MVRSGARQADSKVLIDVDDDLAWTRHITTVGYNCFMWANHWVEPGEPYWVCHGANFGKICSEHFHELLDPRVSSETRHQRMTDAQEDRWFLATEESWVRAHRKKWPLVIELLDEAPPWPIIVLCDQPSPWPVIAIFDD